jgi:hypothetical protein
MRKPTMGDRMDLAEERQARRRQTEAELALEQAEAKAYEQEVKRQRAEAALREQYRDR